MEAVEALTRLGGVGTLAQLRALRVPRRALRRALAGDQVVRRGRGRYALASVGGHRAVAHELTATLSHLSAAQHHGWAVKNVPERPEVIVPRGRKVPRSTQAATVVRWRLLGPGDVRKGVTTPLRTVLDCARDLPFDEALAVADSALRAGDVSSDQLRQAAAGLRGPGAASARRVAAHANALAANPFESVLRALAIEAGLDVEVQAEVAEPGFWGKVDVADRRRRLVLEADSFEHHATRKGFRKDVRRYSVLVVLGWTVLRFSWEDVMLQPDYVRWALRSWAGAREGRPVPPPPRMPSRLA